MKKIKSGFEPGTHGYHELLDRTFLLAQTFRGFHRRAPVRQPSLREVSQKRLCRRRLCAADRLRS